MARILTAAAALAVGLSASAAAAQDPIEPETLTVESEIAPGDNIFVVSTNWGGAGAVSIFSQDDLSYKGDFSTGMNAQMFIGSEGKVGYAASAFPERIMYGPIKAYLQTFDVSTLKTEDEVEIPNKFAQTMAQATALQVTSDGKWALVQNATPATSVSVVDLKSGKVRSEIPVPGCWGIYPSADPAKFSSLCGNGTMLTIKLKSNGKLAGQKYSEDIFDVDSEPLFAHPQRVGDNLIFTSFDGKFFEVSDAGDAAELVGKWSYTEGVEGDWAPGGYEVMAYYEPGGVMFVPMHSGATNGSHKDGSEELWAIDMKEKKILYRSTAEHLTHIAVTQDETPVLFGSNAHAGGLFRYEIDPEAKYAAKLTDEIEVPDVSYLVAE